MKLTQLLIRLGILQASAEPDPAAPGPAGAAPFEKRILKLEELRARSEADQARQEELALGLGLGFEQIYAAAGIGDMPKGLTLEALHDLVEGKPEAEARRILADTLQAAGAERNEVLLAAQQRDHALDQFEELLRRKLDRWEEASRRKAASLREEAQRLLAEAGEVEARIGEIRAKAQAWCAEKEAVDSEAERIAALLVEPPEA